MHRHPSPSRSAVRNASPPNTGFSNHNVDRLSAVSLRIANARMEAPRDSPCSPSARSGPRKRQNPCTDEQPPDNTTAHLSKKRKLAYPSCLPPQFWDGLSKIFLTKNALRELDRRNRQRKRAESLQSTIAPRRSRRLRSSRIGAARDDSLQRVEQVLGQYSSTCLKRLKRFATHGGPDLGDLRGVRP